jgi:valyl-tRNA synthetase
LEQVLSKLRAAHDPNDFEMGVRHNVPFIIIMDEHGVMRGTGTEFDGMDRFDARVAVVAEVKGDGSRSIRETSIYSLSRTLLTLRYNC